MLPAALAPLDPHKTRALTTLYAPRKFKPRNNKTAQNRMLDDITVKPSLTPFHPLPAIGQTGKANTKVILFDLNKNERTDLGSEPMKLQNILQPLTPLRIHRFVRKNSLDQLERKRPQQLLRENTYDVIEPTYLSSVKVRKRDSSIPRRKLSPKDSEDKEDVDNKAKVSPKTRFKNAALQVAKLSSMPETGKLLCLREKQTFNICLKGADGTCKLQELPHSPSQNLNKLSEMFQRLEMKGRHRDKMKKENSWF